MRSQPCADSLANLTNDTPTQLADGFRDGEIPTMGDSLSTSEPRWPNRVAMLAVAGLYAALPPHLLFAGARWLPGAAVVGLLVPITISHRRGNHSLNELLGYILNILVTAAMILSLALLIRAVTRHEVTPQELLRAAASLWSANVLVFASWYWHLDGGGPHQRAMSPGHTDGAFLFPQMSMQPDAKSAAGEDEWEPTRSEEHTSELQSL